MSSAFERLFKAMRDYPQPMNATGLNGYLAGVVLGPEEVIDRPWMQAALGLAPGKPVPARLREQFEAAATEIGEALVEDRFEPVLATEERGGLRLPRADLWCQGFVAAVGLAEGAWEERSERQPQLGKPLLILQVIAEPERHGPIFFGEEVDLTAPEFLLELRAQLIPAIRTVVAEVFFGEDAEGVDEAEWQQFVEAATAAEEALAAELPAHSDQEVITLLVELGAMLPRCVIEECIRRNATIQPHLLALIEDEALWRREDEAAWAPIHAACALGGMEGAAATGVILQLLTRREAAEAQPYEVLDGRWPHLFRNKPEAQSELRHIAEHRENSWYTRTAAVSCVLDRASLEGRLEEALDWAAAIACDDSEDVDTRINVARHLLEMPRERHRSCLEAMAAQPLGSLDDLSAAEIEDAFDAEEDSPEWEWLGAPLDFYSPEEAATRFLQDRMFAEASGEDDEELFDDAAYEPVPFVRESPKVGRNDPCPCGSGKKYKKCCMA